MEESDIEDFALEIVRDYLDDGVEFLSVAENLQDNGFEDEDDWRKVHDQTTKILKELAGNL